jgi:restriction modification system DNA specificity domain protein (fragment)
MKHNWEYKRLGDICDFIGGGTPSKSNEDYFNGNIPWATVRDMLEFHLSNTELSISEDAVSESATNVLPKGMIIISTHVGLGKICELMQDTAINQDLKGVSFSNDIVNKYFFVYWYRSIANYIISKGRGATVKGVTLAFMKNLSIPVPPRDVQEQIVAELDKINEVIADCRELLRNLDALAQSFFYDTFGDPITNPKGWRTDKMGNLLIIERGGSPRPIKEYITDEEDGVNWIKIGDAGGSMYINSTKERIKKSGVPKSRFVKPGDFILSNSMSFGRPYIMNTTGCIHDGWLLLRDTKEVFNKIYLYYCLSSKSLYSEFTRLVRTGTVSNLNSDIVRGVKLSVPPLTLQQQFATRIEAIEAIKATTERQIAELQTLLDSRMDYWFN